MKFPKIRFTIGNVVGVLSGVAGVIVDNSTAVAALSPVGGGKLIAAAALILGASKGLLSFNHESIPDDKKISAGPVVLEKTGPLNNTDKAP
jgi:hypothetical protein